MKRFLIIALVVMLVVAMWAVPAFADGTMSSYIDDHGNVAFPVVPESGRYLCEVTFIIDDGSFTWSGVVQLNYMHEVLDDGTELFASIGIIQLVDGDQKIDLNLGVMQGPDSNYGGESPILCFLGTEHAMFSVVSLTLTPAPVSGEEAAVDSVFGVFTGIGSWLVAELGNATSLFYQADTGLTILGVLAVAGLGIAVVFLLINWVKSLLQFRI